MNLDRRALDLVERMDDPECDSARLRRTYLQFESLNAIVSGWRATYRRWLRPLLMSEDREWSVLDVGTGGGSLLRLLYSFCAVDNVRVRFVGLDPDLRAIRFVETQPWRPEVSFRHGSLEIVAEQGEQFDVVVSNHLMHHLEDVQLQSLCEQADRTARRRVVFSDLRRTPTAYKAFKLIAPLFYRRSFVVEDGLTSIRRSYTLSEMDRILPAGWQVQEQAPYRLVAAWES